MKVIFVTDSYYPKPSPNAICVEKLVSEFERRGVDTSVVALRTFSKNIEDLDDPKVHFVEPDMFYSAWYETSYKADQKKINLLQKIFRLRGALYGAFWPLMSLTHLKRYKRALKQELSSSDDDTIVIGVYKSLEAALAGAMLRDEFPNTKFILYTLDAVAHSIIPTIYGSQKIARRSINRWEKILFNNYDLLYLMKSHESIYMDEHYHRFHDKMRFVDIPLLNLDRLTRIPDSDSDVKHLVFTGSMSKDTADPRYLLDLINQLCDERIHLDFYGNISDPEILSAINSSAYATYHGSVTHQEVADVQSRASMLLNFGNFTPCGIPCKIFEYFSTGKPIISCYKIDEDASKPYMEKYPAALLLDERKNLDANLESLRFFINHIHQTERKDIANLFANNIPDTTVDIIINDYKTMRK